LALTSPTGGGRSVGIVLSRTKAMEFSLVFSHLQLRNPRFEIHRDAKNTTGLC
jgi:hypothetical protein